MEEKMRALEWLVQFANMNLYDLGPGDKAKLLVESEEFLFSRSEGFTMQRTSPTFGQKKKVVLSDEWVAKMDELPHRDSPGYWAIIVESQEIIRKRLEKFIMPNERVRKPLKEVSIWLFWNETFKLSIIPHTRSREDYIDLKLFRLFDNLPHSSIQKCPGCEKFFLNASMRKKKYCSSRCMWRVNAKKLRMADPEGYKKRQAELMRKKYREKQAQKRGVTIEKVIIQKRSSRKKEK
ncbi:MAG: hypothetical protein OEW45_20790 [Deltaproteobacteria bacterium]|nr:hypothetical protein [Deltaproteobacteria bacterium]